MDALRRSFLVKRLSLAIIAACAAAVGLYLAAGRQWPGWGPVLLLLLGLGLAAAAGAYGIPSYRRPEL